MTMFRMLWSGLLFHRRAHLGAGLGAALCAMVLSGALLVGDSLKGTLRSQAEARVGRVRSALLGGEKLFRSQLAEEVGPRTTPVLMLRGSISKADGGGRLNRAQVLGVDGRFFELSQAGERRVLGPGDAAVSAALASRLGVVPEDFLVLRVEKPALFSRDAPLSGEEDALESIRVRVIAVLDDAHFGRFSLQANQVPPATVFVGLETLQNRLDVAGKANLLLSESLDAEGLRRAVVSKWSLEDLGLQKRALSDGVEVRSPRVFLDPPLVAKLPPGRAVLTYFVNAIANEEGEEGARATPYSMVTAVEPGSVPFVPSDLAEDEIVVSNWLSEDLQIEPGALVELRFLVMGAHRKLEEHSAHFRVRDIVPSGSEGWDGTWMPDFPGLADAGNCREWKPGFALALDKIRDKDEAYWKQFRGTPKAFLSLRAARALWANRWGDTTALRYPRGAEPSESQVLGVIRPEDAGFQFVAMRERAQEATRAPVDFAGLFVGFSFFLVTAALVLVGLLFALMVENRGSEAGVLLSLGWSPARVRALFLGEGLVVVLLGGGVGAVLGMGYTRAVLYALSSVWRDATAGTQINFHANAASFVAGALGTVGAALVCMGWVSRRIWRQPARRLLAGECFSSGAAFGGLEGGGHAGRSGPLWMVAACSLAGGGLVGGGLLLKRTDPEWFFGAGMLLLIAGVGFAYRMLGRLASGRVRGIRQMAWRNLGRRMGRSAVLVGVLASGAFLVLSVEVFRKKEGSLETAAHSGTGGYALWGELSSPVYEDLNQVSVRDQLGLGGESVRQVTLLRKREGDEASCLNLNRALEPQLLGVPSLEWEKRGAFRFSAAGQSWAVLRSPLQDGTIPAVVDEATMRWALQKKVGDILMLPDGRGGRARLRIVAALQGSLLQGALMIEEADFVRLYPDLGGYRALLVDADAQELDAVRSGWSRALADRGLELVRSSRRLAELDAVANAYLSIFQVLGGLGVLLGTLGGGVVAARNIVERRSELALL
ncbi:MAG: hypothetical protein RLZZ142_2470, partial [Verrucomicrobiota bacterium]